MKESGFGPKDVLSMVVSILPLKLGVRPSINAVGRRIVYVMFPSLAFSLRQASMLCLLMKWGTYVGFVSDFAPPRRLYEYLHTIGNCPIDHILPLLRLTLLCRTILQSFLYGKHSPDRCPIRSLEDSLEAGRYIVQVFP